MPIKMTHIVNITGNKFEGRYFGFVNFESVILYLSKENNAITTPKATNKMPIMEA